MGSTGHWPLIWLYTCSADELRPERPVAHQSSGELVRAVELGDEGVRLELGGERPAHRLVDLGVQAFHDRPRRAGGRDDAEVARHGEAGEARVGDRRNVGKLPRAM